MRRWPISSRETIAAFEKAIRDSGIAAPLFITQNDGTVAEAGQARRLPVYSFASGATNSMRGAAYLSGLADAMVIDVGGTTTDVGQLKNGFPREANSVVKVGGVRTLFRMPDLLSIGLGGGSHVQLDPLEVGPVSVGYRLLKEGIAFGGKQLTTTDIAVASGVLTLGDKAKVAHLDAATCKKVFDEAARLAEEAIDRMKTEAGDVPLIAVGGGAFLIPEKLPGVSKVIHVAARRLRQCRRRRDRPGLGRMRPDLQGPEPHGCAGRGAGHRQRPRRGGGRRARLAGDHRERGHAAGLPAGQFGAGEGAGRRRRRRCRCCVVGGERVMLFRTASFQLAHESLSERDARGPEEHEMRVQRWRLPEGRIERERLRVGPAPAEVVAPSHRRGASARRGSECRSAPAMAASRCQSRRGRLVEMPHVTSSLSARSSSQAWLANIRTNRSIAISCRKAPSSTVDRQGARDRHDPSLATTPSGRRPAHQQVGKPRRQ